MTKAAKEAAPVDVKLSPVLATLERAYDEINASYYDKAFQMEYINTVKIAGEVRECAMRVKPTGFAVLSLTIDTEGPTNYATSLWDDVRGIPCVMRGESAWRLEKQIAVGALVSATAHLNRVNYEDKGGKFRYRLEVELDGLEVLGQPAGCGHATAPPAATDDLDLLTEVWGERSPF
jgi:hypothetical protein